MSEVGASSRAPSSSRHGSRAGEHTVRFYESDRSLLESLRAYFSTGLLNGEAAVVVATEMHRAELARLLEADGFDIPGLIAANRYISLDAATLLTAFMRNGEPDADLFHSTVGTIVAGAAAGDHPVRIFGEMVSLLWTRHEHVAAIRLEELWNDLQARDPFSLWCGYPIGAFAERSMEASFAEICARHTRVYPAESYGDEGDEQERLRAVATLQQRALTLEREAQEAMRRRDDFLTAASHDLKTPLAVILGNAQMLTRRLSAKGEVDSRMIEGLKSIERRARTMAAVVEELAEATRLGPGGNIVLQREFFDLAELVEEISLEQQRMSHRHHLITEIVDRPITGFWDQVRLTRVVGNLIGNAIKYSPGGGDITVRLWREEREGPWAILSIRDVGMGIPALDLPHVFTRFFRAENVLASTAGTGIGLSTARHIVERHGGIMTAESTEGAGSTFVVHLPLSAQPS